AGQPANRIGAMDVRAAMRPAAGGSWVGETVDGPQVRVEAASREGCLTALRDAVRASSSADRAEDTSLTILVEVVATVAGVAEAAAVMGWDKRRVITYIDRGRFPEPLQSLASGRVWLREDVERFAHDWHSRREGRTKDRA